MEKVLPTHPKTNFDGITSNGVDTMKRSVINLSLVRASLRGLLGGLRLA